MSSTSPVRCRIARAEPRLLARDRVLDVAVVGVARWVLHLPGCRTLKEKRSIVRGLKDRMISRFRLSVAETDLHARHAMAELTAAVASRDRRHAEAVLSKADRLVRDDPRAQVVEAETEFF